MNRLQQYALQRSIRLAAESRTRSNPPKRISTADLVALVNNSLGKSGTTERTMPTSPPSLLSASEADIAICVGGGNDPLADYATARALCDSLGKSVCNLVCNDTLMTFPETVHHAVTLHPDKWRYWKGIRQNNGHPEAARIWAHRPYRGFTDWTKDWQGSSGLFMTKIARTLGHTHVILCGIPMSPEGGHFARKQPWGAAMGFRKGWERWQESLRPFVRSVSGGWTQEFFGAPDTAWLMSSISDPNPPKLEHSGVSA